MVNLTTHKMRKSMDNKLSILIGLWIVDKLIMIFLMYLM